MSNMFSSRKGPLLIAAGLFGGLMYTTYGAKQQPRPRAVGEAGVTDSAPVSEKLQAVAGTGGARARDTQEVGPPGSDVKDARLGTSDVNAPSKKEAGKVRD